MNTDEIRRAIREDKPDWIWLRCTLTEALAEIDRLEKEPLLSDNEFNEVQIKREVEQRIKAGCLEKVWGWLTRFTGIQYTSLIYDSLKQAIDSAGGKVMDIGKKIADLEKELKKMIELGFESVRVNPKEIIAIIDQLKACREELNNERILFNSLSQCLKEAKQDIKDDIWHRIQIFLKDECRPDKESIPVIDLKKAFKDDLDDQD